MSRDRLENAMRRLHSDALANTTIEVYEPTTDYTPGDGFDVVYPATPTATLEARIEPPDERGQTDRSGTTIDADAIVRVRDDTEITWTEYGFDGQATARVADIGSGAGWGTAEWGTSPWGNLASLYQIETRADAHDGLLELAATEV